MRKFLGAIVVLGAMALTGCGDTIQEGNFGVQRGSFSGKYENEVLQSGWYFRPFTDIFVTDGREMVVPVNTDPKDVDGISLPAVRVEVRVRVKNPNLVPDMLRGTLRLESNPNLGVYQVGISRLTTDAIATVRQVSEKLKAEKMFSDNAAYANDIKMAYQSMLDKNYPGLFEVSNVNVLKVDVPNFVQQKISSVAARAAEIEQNNASIAAIDSRKTLQDKEANLLRENIKASGLTADQYIRMKTIEIVKEIFDNQQASDSERGGNSGNNNGNSTHANNSSSVPMIILNIKE